MIKNYQKPIETQEFFLLALDSFVEDIIKGVAHQDEDRLLQSYFEDNLSKFDPYTLQSCHNLLKRLPSAQNYIDYVRPFIQATQEGTQKYPLLIDLDRLKSNYSGPFVGRYIKSFLHIISQQNMGEKSLKEVFEQLNDFSDSPTDIQIKKHWFIELSLRYKSSLPKATFEAVESVLKKILSAPIFIEGIKKFDTDLKLHSMLYEVPALFNLLSTVQPELTADYKTQGQGQVGLQNDWGFGESPAKEKFQVNGLQRLFVRWLQPKHTEWRQEIQEFYDKYHKDILEPVGSTLFFQTRPISFVELIIKREALEVLPYLNILHLNKEDLALLAGYVGYKLRFIEEDKLEVANSYLEFFKSCPIELQAEIVPQLLILERPHGYPLALEVKQKELIKVLSEQIALETAIEEKPQNITLKFKI